MQLPFAISGKGGGREERYLCSNGAVALFTPSVSSHERILPYVSDPGPLHPFRYLLNRYVRDLVAIDRCGGRWPKSAQDLGNWRLTGFYIGLETEDTDERDGTIRSPAGVVATGLQIANVSLLTQ